MKSLSTGVKKNLPTLQEIAAMVESGQMTEVQSRKVLKSLLSDRTWRLNNLYYIRDKNGNKVKFKMNKAQLRIYDNLWYFNIIPKARQLGVTTFFCILYFDAILFGRNKACTIIAHDKTAMEEIFRDKVKFAYDNLPNWVRSGIAETKSDSKYEMSFDNGSIIRVAQSARGGVVQYLHISEFGKICAKYPAKAKEIVTGSINAVEAGNFVSIESTAEGPDGYFYDFSMAAQKKELMASKLTPLDFKLFFFPWWYNDEYRLSGAYKPTADHVKYFDDLKSKWDIDLDNQQKHWYIKKYETNKSDMFAEYPSHLEEAFRVSIEGAIYNKEMLQVYEEQRIANVPYNPEYRIDTWWDLGVGDLTVIWFTQTIGGAIHVINCYANNGEGIGHYVQILEDYALTKNYRYNKHHYPWDVMKRSQESGKTYKKLLYEAGIPRGTLKVAKKERVKIGIEQVQSIFHRFVFDDKNTKEIYTSLAAYRREWDEKAGMFKQEPRHDINSHYADPARVLVQFWKEDFSKSSGVLDRKMGAVDSSTTFTM